MITDGYIDRFKQTRSQSGAYLVLISFFLLVLVGLCALVMGLGFISTGKSRLQAISNIASLGAIEAYVRSTEANPADRVDAALVRANQLIAENSRVPGMEYGLAPIDLNGGQGTFESGRLSFGLWYHEEPSDGSDPCVEYPCFVVNDTIGQDSRINAARVEVRTSSSNPLIAPFAKLFGLERNLISAQSLGTVIQRCTAYALDTSLSVAEETHLNPPNARICFPYGQWSVLPSGTVLYNPPYCFGGAGGQGFRTFQDELGGFYDNFVDRCGQCGLGRLAAYDDSNNNLRPDCGETLLPVEVGRTLDSCPPAVWIKSPTPSLFAYRFDKIWPPSGDANPDTPITPPAGVTVAYPDAPYGPPGANLPTYYIPSGAIDARHFDTPPECYFDLSRLDLSLENLDFIFWCNQDRTRGPNLLNPVVHPREDYYFMPAQIPGPSGPGTNSVRFLVDNFFTGYGSTPNYWGPQPLSRFYLAFNAGLRTVETLRSPGDKAMIYAFQGDDVGQEPLTSEGLTEDLQSIIRLTNFSRRGFYDSARNPYTDAGGNYEERTPHAIERGWFPRASATHANVLPQDGTIPGTNIVRALRVAYDALALCPDSASKSIIMASDGVATCTFGIGNGDEGFHDEDAVIKCPSDDETNIYQNYYQNSEAHLLGDVRAKLQEFGIGLTVLIDSAVVDPNMLNINHPQLGWLLPSDALGSAGYCAYPGSPNCTNGSFFNLSPEWPGAMDVQFDAWLIANNLVGQGQNPSVRNRFAFENRSASGVRFRQPMGALFQLVKDTGGVVCPVMPTCNDSGYDFPAPPGGNPQGWYYDHDNNIHTPSILSPEFRSLVGQGNPLRCSPILLTRAEQAIACVLGALGGNPFQNVEEVSTQ